MAPSSTRLWSTEPDVPPDVDEFDLDLRVGELAAWGGWSLSAGPRGAQTDPQGCLPTGGIGGEGTCNTQNPTCPGTCAGRGTCPHTQCNTCGNTCAGNTCPRTGCNTCAETCGVCPTDVTCGTQCNTHCFTCRAPCQPR